MLYGVQADQHATTLEPLRVRVLKKDEMLQMKHANKTEQFKSVEELINPTTYSQVYRDRSKSDITTTMVISTATDGQSWCDQEKVKNRPLKLL